MLGGCHGYCKLLAPGQGHGADGEDLYRGMFRVGVGQPAAVGVAVAVDHLEFVALAHSQHSHGMSRVAFGQFGRACYVRSEKLYHLSVKFLVYKRLLF